MALLNVAHMVIVGCGLTAVATGAQRSRIVGDWVNRAARTPGVEILRCDALAQRCKAAGLTPEPFPWLQEFEQDNN